MSTHKPVLLQEVIEGLNLSADQTFVDATYGGGGHSSEVKRRFPGITAVGIDQDPRVEGVLHGNFRNIDKLLGDTHPDAILFDLGWSSDQLTGKGMSFMVDEPLDMRLSGQGFTAADVVNTWDESAIELILRGFGQEKYSRKIAKAIVEARPLTTTFDLVRVVESVVFKREKINPATRTFQALRITVNEELTALEEGLAAAFDQLRPGGRVAVISFHSLEDRIVKNFFRDRAKEGAGELVTKKPIVPSEAEILENPRSRSAKLRIIKKYDPSTNSGSW